VFTNNTNACDDGNACTADDRCAPPTVPLYLAENFDGVVAPALPVGWTSAASGGGALWKTNDSASDSAPNSAFGLDAGQVANEVLATPEIFIASPTAHLTFRNRWSFEDLSECWDAGVLEIRIGSGDYIDIEAAGGTFVSGGYTGSVYGFASNPLAFRRAWCFTSAHFPGFLTTDVALPASAAGHTIQLRWRIGTDLYSYVFGQNIDSVVIGDPANGCHGGPALDCDDDNPCTSDSCAPGTGCVHADTSSACDDGNPCTDDACDPAVGCVHGANTQACDDGNPCTTSDTCGGGSCNGTPVVCDDHNACTSDRCDPATGCIFVNNTLACDDGNACTTGDVCGPRFTESFDGSTSPALPPNWTSSVVGAGDLWVSRSAGADTEPNSAFGRDAEDIADATIDSPAIAITSAAARLTFRNRWSFDDPTDCYDAGVLEIKIGAGAFADILTAGGSFLSGGYTGTVDINWGNPLGGRAAWCSVSPGYPGYVTTDVKLPAAAAGQTIQFRWRLGTDTSAVSVGQDIDSIVITDPMNTCNGGPAPDCDDNNPCTDDSCDPSLGCVHASNTVACNDGSVCTSGDVCGGGTCSGVAINCDDGNVCTFDFCDPASGCFHADNNATCDDGNACTRDDRCSAGRCLGPAIVCYDGNPCTDDACIPSTGCVFFNNTALCNDGNACTTLDRCEGGTCHAGPPRICGDNNPCTTDSCQIAAGCIYSFNTEPCDDGNACTSGDACGGGSCHGGTPNACDDNNPCTDDSCSPATGCAHTNTTAACSDGDACTSGDVCGDGRCHAGTSITCNDGNDCTTDSCDSATGCVFANNTNACDDGNACTQTDACGNGACVGSNPVVCVAADHCHDSGVCNPASGACSSPVKPDGTACSDNSLCTTGDTCQAGTCTPTFSGLNEPNPRSNGWYKRLCHGPHSGDQLTDADAACVGSVAHAFAGISTVADICAELEPSQPNNDPCDRTDDDLMVLALNICRARVCVAQGIDSQCGSNDHVAQSLAESDAILASPSRSDTTCAHAKCLDEEVNTGRALELNSLTLRREAEGVRLDWRPPYLDDGINQPAKYNVWRRVAGSLSPFTKIGAPKTPGYLDTTAGSGTYEYEVTAVMN
jgi:hypothetical protein